MIEKIARADLYFGALNSNVARIIMTKRAKKRAKKRAQNDLLAVADGTRACKTHCK